MCYRARLLTTLSGAIRARNRNSSRSLGSTVILNQKLICSPLGAMMNITSTFNDSDAYKRQMGRWSRRLAEPFLDFAEVRDRASARRGLRQWQSYICNRQSVKAISHRWPRSDAGFHRSCRSQDTNPAIEFQIGDACALPFQNASFNRVLSLLMLHFVPQTELAISELRRVAKPGATVAAAVWDGRGGFVAQRMFFDIAATVDPVGGGQARAQQFTRPLCRPGELEAAWRAAGFQNVMPTTVMTRMEFANFDDFWSPYLGKQAGAAAYVTTLTDDQRQKLKEVCALLISTGSPMARVLKR